MATKYVCDFCDTVIQKDGGIRLERAFEGNKTYRITLDLCDPCWAGLRSVVAEKGRTVDVAV